MLLTINNLSKRYGDQLVLQNISLILNPTDRAGLVGANGVGKSTLFKILNRLETADQGEIIWQDNPAVGYLPQTMPDFAGQTVDEVIGEAVRELREMEQQLRTLEARLATSPGEQLDTILHYYGELSHQFEARGGYELEHRLDQVMTGLRLDYLSRQQPVAHLSGGEKTRLQLAGLLLQSPAVLLLDEPTNHLSFDVLAAFETALANFRGPIIAVTHDRWFVNQFGGEVWWLQAGQLRPMKL